MIGSMLAHYEILELLGEGGMGQVYRARDTKLGREIALKVLSAEMAMDPDRRMRFEREARAVAALKHPHIVTIHSVEEADGRLFLTMELVEGRMLSELIPPHGMALEQFFAISVPLVDALASAHQKGITHRDLKPANVMLGLDKQLKVLDFGLAKVLVADFADKETMTQGATAEGRILGTVAYMSPEQAEGKAVDHRSDIFSLGVLLYEMATGDRPFKGDTNISTITSILRDDPPSITELKQSLPRHLGRIVRRCLAKDPDRRYQTALDLKNDLLELKEEIASGELELPAGAIAGRDAGPSSAGLPAGAGRAGVTRGSGGAGRSRTGLPPSGTSPSDLALQPPSAGSGRRWILGIGVAAAVGLLAIAYFALRPKSPGAPTAPAAQAMRVTRLTGTGKSIEAAISPDGKMVVHVQRDQGKLSLWLTQVSTASSVEILPASDADIWDPTFDPAGEFVYYIRSARGSAVPELWRVPALGGTPRKILGGADQTISFSPDGSRFAFLRTEPTSSTSMIMTANADGSGATATATREGPGMGGAFNENPAWSPDGKLLAAPVQDILPQGIVSYVVVFPVGGGPEQRLAGHNWFNVTEIAWLPDQSGLVLAASEGFTGSQLWELAYPAGTVRRITNDVNEYNGVSLTADGRTLAVGLDEQSFTLQVADAERATGTTALTSGKGRQDGDGIAWTPDGRIVYGSLADGGLNVWISGADGSGAEKISTMTATQPSLSDDGRTLVFMALQGGVHIWKSDLEGRNPVQLTHGRGELQPELSPDGRWLVYAAGVDGLVYKMPVEGGDSILVSTRPGSYTPIISPDGTRIAFRSYNPETQKIQTVIVPFEGGEPVAVLDLPDGPHQWSPDGRAITYAEEKDGVGNLWSMPISGGTPRQLTRFTDSFIIHFAWSRDGKRVALCRGNSSSDVVLLTDFR